MSVRVRAGSLSCCALVAALATFGPLPTSARPDDPPLDAATRRVDSEVRVTNAPPPGLACIDRAYPGVITHVEDGPNGPRVTLRSGSVVDWDDGRSKTHEELLAAPDLEDTLAIRYPRDAAIEAPAVDVEPGRARNEPLLDATYGASRAEVGANLVPVPWPYTARARAPTFNRRNGASEALARVATALRALPASSRRFLAPLAGTFQYRSVRGESRRSAHAYGIAIDLNIRQADYWRWTRPFTGAYRNRIPIEIVRAFEREKFVWGGRWYHFDTMHFEYRPELFDDGC